MFNDDLILAIDYGESFLGLAVSSGELSSPLMNLRVKDLSLEKIVGEIRQATSNLKIKKLVIGVPEGNMGDKIRSKGMKIAKMLELSVEFVDETLSSIETGVEKNNHDKAAAIILQRYLDDNRVF